MIRGPVARSDPDGVARKGWHVGAGAGETARPLFGRDQARETILLVAHRAVDRGGAVLVTGEAGLGKTALLADVAERLDGWTLLRVHADSFESDLAYATVETLIRGLNGLRRDRAPRLP